MSSNRTWKEMQDKTMKEGLNTRNPKVEKSIKEWTELFLDMRYNCDMCQEQIKGYCRRSHGLTDDDFNTLSEKVGEHPIINKKECVMERTSEAKRLLRELQQAKARYANSETSFDAWYGERRMIITEAKHLNVVHEILDIIHGSSCDPPLYRNTIPILPIDPDCGKVSPCEECEETVSETEACGDAGDWLCPDCYGERRESKEGE